MFLLAFQNFSIRPWMGFLLVIFCLWHCLPYYLYILWNWECPIPISVSVKDVFYFILLLFLWWSYLHLNFLYLEILSKLERHLLLTYIFEILVFCSLKYLCGWLLLLWIEKRYTKSSLKFQIFLNLSRVSIYFWLHQPGVLSA